MTGDAAVGHASRPSSRDHNYGEEQDADARKVCDLKLTVEVSGSSRVVLPGVVYALGSQIA